MENTIINQQGMSGMADAMQILLNEAMKIERSQYLGAEHYERNLQRTGYANGYKPK
ncbi:MAG: IS256 family transposase, partial [Desulfobacteraceae bacterium]|nr:IS256 family transposase [Desulfobacteraceae bacterium]